MYQIPKIDLISGFQDAKFKEARDKKGKLSLLNNAEVREKLKNLPVINVVTKEKKFL